VVQFCNIKIGFGYPLNSGNGITVRVVGTSKTEKHIKMVAIVVLFDNN
jgi:hypothetical protein